MMRLPLPFVGQLMVLILDRLPVVNFATDLPPLISDLEKVCELPETEQLSELQQNTRHQQEVLLKVKDYLVYLHEQQGKGGGGVESAMIGNDAGSIAAAVIQELQLKRTEWVAPISQEITQLTAQKQILEREIYRLNQQYEAVLREFPQQLLAQFQGSLQTQLSKAVELFEQRLRYISSVTHSIQGMDDAGFAASEAQTDIGRSPAEHLQAVQGNLDKSIADLDSTIHTVFTALGQDITAYGNSLTGDLRQLNGIQAVMDRAASEQISVAPTPVDILPLVPEEPDTPELESLMDLATDSEVTSDAADKLPAADSLFGESDLGFERDPITPEPIPEAINTTVIQEEITPTTANDLFGDSPDLGSAVADLSDEALPAETTTFLFGDAPSTEDTTAPVTKVPDLKTVIATPASTTADTAVEDADPTKVKTIQLLTDLLEDGSLNVQDSDTAIADNDAEEEPDLAPVEDLNPDIDPEEEVATATVTVLDPEQLTQLAEDLEQFETTVEESPTTDDVIEAVVSSADDNPWDDDQTDSAQT